MQSILFQSQEFEDTDWLVYDLWENGVAGIVEEPEGLRAYFEDGTDITELQRVYSKGISETRREEGFKATSPNGASAPVLAGTSFFIVDPSSIDPTPHGRMRLAVQATDAFGSGRHESTQLVVEALETLLKPNDTVIDVGCGSGILMAAAKMLAAGPTFGCDIHVGAIETARAQTCCPLFLGGPDAICEATADVVLANISASVVDALAYDLNRIAKPNGWIVLAGFIEENTPNHFTPAQVLQKGEWLCWLCRPRPVAESGPVQPFKQQWW